MSPLAWLLVKLLLAYLLGSVSGSLLLGRLRGVDIRTLGSGNAGGTNAFRTQGAAFGLAVILIDAGKGALAAVLGGWNGFESAALLPGSGDALAAGAAATIGHVWPIFYGFRGGKGAGTLIGAMLVIAPLTLLPSLATWLLVLGSTGYVGLGTVCAGVVLPLAVRWLVPADAILLGFALSVAVFLVWTHRSNLQRLASGTEHRFERARLLDPSRWRRSA